jgi:hypothetical protein
MTRIYNTELFTELKDGVRLQQLTDTIPSQLADKVVPVMEVNPKLLRVINWIKPFNYTATSTSVSLLVADATKDYYITNVDMGLVKDATCDRLIGEWYITATINSVSTVICSIPTLALTAQTSSINLMFPIPIKIDRGTAITLGSFTYTAGLSCRAVSIKGYTVDNPKA